MKQLTLYTRVGCHLCEDMYAALETMQSRYTFSLRCIDIDRDPMLRAEYNHQIPLLVDAHGVEICRYFFEEKAFHQALT
jgi:glutaredoxin